MKLTILSLIFAGLLAAECPTPPPCVDGAICYTELEGCRHYARHFDATYRAEQVWDSGSTNHLRWVWTLDSWVIASQPGLRPSPIHDKNGYNVTCLYGMSPVDTGRESERGTGELDGFWCAPYRDDVEYKTAFLESALRSANIRIRAAEIDAETTSATLKLLMQAMEALTKRIEKLEEKRK